MNIIGTLMKVRYQSETSKWGTYSVKTKSDGIVSMTGVMPNPILGQSYQFGGDFEEHPKYGRQFKFFTHAPLQDDTADGVLALLSSGRFKGIGPSRAATIIKRFGKDTLKIIREDPQRLTEVSGIGPALAAQIGRDMPDVGVWEELRMLLPNVTDNAINKIYNQYGDDAVSTVKKNPYTLIKDLDGYGFIKADAIAASIGITGAHPLRVQAAVYHCLDTASEKDGHCYSYASNLQENVAQLIPGVGVTDIASAIKEMQDESYARMRVHVDNDGAIYLYDLWRSEMTVAKVVRELALSVPLMTIPSAAIDSAVRAISATTGIELDETQRKAVERAVNKRICVITGGPGTGKTTIIRTIISALMATIAKEDDIALLAPTGRAARRMRETTGHSAHTIHSMLLNKELHRYKHIIIDETSMVDINLAARLLANIGQRVVNVIFIGDVDQLPAIGPGVFLRDMIAAYEVPTVKLKFSFRQKGSIACNADSINHGMGPHAYVEDEDFGLIVTDKEHGPEQAIAEYFKLVDEYGVNEAIVLSPTRARGAGGTNALNREIQSRLFPSRSPNELVKLFDFDVGVGDRVMLTKNRVIPLHANGDIGTVTDIGDGQITILFDGDAEPINALLVEIKPYLTLAYACTVHKSQGSEYKGVVVLLTTEHFIMAERSILYTAVTRAKNKCRLVCDTKTVNAAVKKINPVLRNSKLKLRLNGDEASV